MTDYCKDCKIKLPDFIGVIVNKQERPVEYQDGKVCPACDKKRKRRRN